jgi:hypothetical protein
LQWHGTRKAKGMASQSHRKGVELTNSLCSANFRSFHARTCPYNLWAAVHGCRPGKSEATHRVAPCAPPAMWQGARSKQHVSISPCDVARGYGSASYTCHMMESM